MCTLVYTRFAFYSDLLLVFIAIDVIVAALLLCLLVLLLLLSEDLCLCTSLFISIRFDECTGISIQWNGRWLKTIKKITLLKNNCIFHIIILWFLISATMSLFVWFYFAFVCYRFYESWWKRLTKKKCWKVEREKTIDVWQKCGIFFWFEQQSAALKSKNVFTLISMVWASAYSMFDYALRLKFYGTFKQNTLFHWDSLVKCFQWFFSWSCSNGAKNWYFSIDYHV